MIGAGKPTLRIRGTSYPVLLPSLPRPQAHLAAVIVSLQVLGQVAFDFRLSIAQILVSLLTCAVLEMGIAFRRQHVIWPGECAPDRQRRRLSSSASRGRSTATGGACTAGGSSPAPPRRAALEAPDPVPGRPHLQPLELRARRLLPAARPGARRPARVLVGADVRLARARPGDHRRRRLRDPAAAAPAPHRGHLLGHLRRLDRRPRGERPRHDDPLASARSPTGTSGACSPSRPRSSSSSSS